MAISVVMPALEMAQENGKLLAWRKKEGESVSKGEPLLEIETDKAVVEVEAPGDGILAGITADVGAVIPVGETIAWLVGAGREASGKGGYGCACGEGDERGASCGCGAGAGATIDCGWRGCADFAEGAAVGEGTWRGHCADSGHGA